MTQATKRTWGAAGVLAAVLLPAAASAQMRGGGMGPTPVGVPLDKVPVGTWAEYTVKRGDQPARKMRYALVGREGAAFVVETATERGEGGRMLVRSVVEGDPTKEGAIKKVVIQIGDGDPMEMPAGRPAGEGGGEGRGGGPRMGARFVKPDPKNLVGKETVKVAAGSFQAERYREQNPRGGTLDYWIAKDAGPLGLVKMQIERPGGDGDGGGGMTVELAARGKGAKPEVTRPAKPFDPEAMRGLFGGGRGEGRGRRGGN